MQNIYINSVHEIKQISILIDLVSLEGDDCSGKVSILLELKKKAFFYSIVNFLFFINIIFRNDLIHFLKIV